MVLVGKEGILAAGGGGNMAAPLLAKALGGPLLFGFICAVAFATILAVVAGLTLSGAAALSHDLWVSTIKGGHASEEEQLKVARIASIILGICAILLGIAFQGQNVAYMVGLTFSIAASANFPALMLAIFWRRLTTAGAVCSILFGAFLIHGLEVNGIKAILCMLFLILTSPVSAHALARAAHKSGVKLWEKSVVDRYAEDGR